MRAVRLLALLLLVVSRCCIGSRSSENMIRFVQERTARVQAPPGPPPLSEMEKDVELDFAKELLSQMKKSSQSK